jgi:Fe-S cluster assembly ATP-binding protein
MMKAGGDMLGIEHLTVKVGDKEILHDVNLNIKTGETHVLFGPNGSGKTTLLMAIMGLARYQITKGNIRFKGEDITKLSPDERARLGIGMSLQRPPVIRGVKTRDMVVACIRGMDKSEEDIDMMAHKANLMDLMDREVNYGFSGGGDKTI